MRTLKQIAEEHPALIFDNDGYECLDQSKLSASDLAAFDEVGTILKGKIEGFVEFFNFKPRPNGSLDARVTHAWDKSFIGKGYFSVELIDKEPSE